MIACAKRATQLADALFEAEVGVATTVQLPSGATCQTTALLEAVWVGLLEQLEGSDARSEDLPQYELVKRLAGNEAERRASKCTDLMLCALTCAPVTPEMLEQRFRRDGALCAAIHYAALGGNAAALERLLDEAGAKNARGASALKIAAAAGRRDCAALLWRFHGERVGLEQRELSVLRGWGAK